ncbi:MAG: prepilin-type N-terminal cleavage/methylation domain-containing protein [Microgenomates group bacterium]
MKRGFTLIELMVVISISMLLITGVSVAVTRFSSGENLNAAMTELVTMFDLARSTAVSNQTTTGFVDLDYVAVTLTTDGWVSIMPVNNSTGVGNSFSSKYVGGSGIIFTSLNFGDLLFAAGNGKLLGKDPLPSYSSYPLSSAAAVGVTITSANVGNTRQVIINSFGAVTESIL